jgi:hypothetical protein
MQGYQYQRKRRGRNRGGQERQRAIGERQPPTATAERADPRYSTPS